MPNRTDTFDRTNSVLTMNSPSDAGGDWTLSTGLTCGIDTNRGYFVVGVGQDTAWLESSLADVDVEATFRVTASDEGLVARVADENNYILLLVAAAVMRIFKRVAGGFTLLASSGAISAAADDVFRLRVDSADDLTGYLNAGSQVTANDAAGSTNTKHGLRDNGVGTQRFDNFSITDLSAPAPATPRMMLLGVG